MATDTTSSNQKPLSEKSQAELVKETRARLHHLDPVTASELVGEVTKPVTGTVSGFVQFLRERAVVGLAVGFVFGTQVQSIVKGFTDAFVAPILNLILPAQSGKSTFDQRSFTLSFHGRSADFKWGELVYAILEFLLVAIIFYATIKLFKLDKWDKK